MQSLGRRITKKMWRSHQEPCCVPSLQTTALQPEDLDGAWDQDGRWSPRTSCSQSRPETPLRTAAPTTPKSSVSLAASRSTKTQDDIAHGHSRCPSVVHVPLLLCPRFGEETDSTISIKPSFEHASPSSSRTVSSFRYPTSSLAGSTPCRGAFDGTNFEHQLSCDRSVELVWSRRIHPVSRVDVDGETAFRVNLLCLRDMATLNTKLSTPESRTKKQGEDSSPLKGPGEGPGSQLRAACKGLLPRDLGNANRPYFRLPNHIRFKIMEHTLASQNPHHKPIRMNHPRFLCEAWPVNRPPGAKIWSEDYFDSLQSVLSSLRNYTSVCPAMRADVLATLFLTRRFHVVYSPYVTRELEMAATYYMDRYGPLMASITLEVDFTKLGGGSEPEAVNSKLDSSFQRVKQLVERFVWSQLTHRRTAIRDLRVLVRRYHGHRPQPPTSPKTTKHRVTEKKTGKPPTTTTTLTEPFPPMPSTADALVSNTLAPLKSLGPLVQTLTVTGAPEYFASELITSLWGTSKVLLANDTEQIARHITYRFPAREYPLLPGQRAVVDYGPGPGPRGEKDGEGEGKVGLQVVVGDQRGVAGEGWEGVGNRCRLLVREEGRANSGVGGDEGGKEKGFWSNKGGGRVARRLSEGVRGLFALRGNEKEGKGTESRERGIKVLEDPEVRSGEVEAENRHGSPEEQIRPRARNTVRTGRKGLFGHY